MEEESDIQYDVEGLKDEIRALANGGGTMDASPAEINRVADKLGNMSEREIVTEAGELGIPIENYQISNGNGLTK